MGLREFVHAWILLPGRGVHFLPMLHRAGARSGRQENSGGAQEAGSVVTEAGERLILSMAFGVRRLMLWVQPSHSPR